MLALVRALSGAWPDRPTCYRTQRHTQDKGGHCHPRTASVSSTDWECEQYLEEEQQMAQGM